MKKINLVILCIFCFVAAHAQKSDKSPFENLKHWDNQKPTLIYVFASWCGGTIENFAAIADTMELYRDRFNLVVLIDTSSRQFSTVKKKQLLFQSDTTIRITDYYPYKLMKRYEMKELTRQFNSRYGTAIFRLGPASMLLINEQNQFEKAFSPYNTAQELGEYFRSSKINDN